MIKLTITQLKSLRNLYADNWQKYVPTIALLDHFIDRFTNHSEWIDKVDFLSINEITLKSGTFVMVYKTVDGHCIAFQTLESTPYPNLQYLLNALTYSEGKWCKFWTISEDYLNLIETLVKANNFEKLEEGTTECSVYAPLDRDRVVKMLQDAPDGFYYNSLRDSDAQKIKSTLSYIIPDGYIEDIIKYNPTTGLYKNDGELVAWALMHETGESGMLEVDGNYKRRGFGKGIILRQVLKFHDRGRLFFGHVFDGNDAGREFSIKLDVGDHTWAGKYKYITARLSVINIKNSKL